MSAFGGGNVDMEDLQMQWAVGEWVADLETMLTIRSLRTTPQNFDDEPLVSMEDNEAGPSTARPAPPMSRGDEDDIIVMLEDDDSSPPAKNGGATTSVPQKRRDPPPAPDPSAFSNLLLASAGILDEGDLSHRDWMTQQGWAENWDDDFGLLAPEDEVIIRPYGGDDDDIMLQELRPRFVIMYEPNLAFIRRLEVSSTLVKGYLGLIKTLGLQELQPRSGTARVPDDVHEQFRRRSVLGRHGQGGGCVQEAD